MSKMDRESRALEYKQTIDNYRKLAQTVVAFANGDGGRIIIGIKDASRKVVGLEPDKIDELMERIPVSLADLIQPSVYPQLYERTIEDKEVLIIQVFPANQKPCFIASEGIEKGVYIRVGAHTRRASGEALEELRLLRSRMKYDEVPITDCPSGELMRTALPSHLRTDKSLDSLGVFKHDPFSGNRIPTRGGILVLHPSPDKYVPEAYSIVSRMRGDKGRGTIESHDVMGPIPEQGDSIITILEQWLGGEPAIKGSRYLNQKWRLPMEAVREAVNNALLHRQYSIPGALKIALYSSRLEIFSPGHFAGPFIPDYLGDGTSYIRNHIICKIARRMGLIEKRGTGIRLIQDKMSEAGLPAPLFEEGAQWFKVSLFMTPAEKSDARNQEYDKVMRLFNKTSVISSSDVRKALSVSKATAVSVLRGLMKDELIEKIGRGPSTRYIPK